MIGGARREAFEHDAMLRGDCAFGLAVELCWIGAELCPGAALTSVRHSRTTALALAETTGLPIISSACVHAPLMQTAMPVRMCRGLIMGVSERRVFQRAPDYDMAGRFLLNFLSNVRHEHRSASATHFRCVHVDQGDRKSVV